MDENKVKEFKSINCKVFKDYELIFDEKGSSYGTMRLVQWYKDGGEPDEEKAKLELRKIFTNSGEEKLGKGYTFSTPEGPHELAEGLVQNGFGDTKKILRSVRGRDDFLEAAKSIDSDDDNSYDGELFDMRSLMLNDKDEYDAAEQ